MIRHSSGGERCSGGRTYARFSMGGQRLPPRHPCGNRGRDMGRKGGGMTDGDNRAVDISRFDTLLFDLDGVITRTATLHATAWKDLFDAFLASRADATGEPFVPFDVDTDYLLYVDGRRRYDGVDTFLRSRGIVLPYGDPSDPPDAGTSCGLGNRKNGYFAQRL